MNRPPPTGNVLIKSAGDPASEMDGTRILVDRTWPRGLNKATAAIDEWIKQVAPSPKLAKWFNHDAARWEEFCERYAREIHIERLDELRALAEQGVITLVYSATDHDHNTAAALKGLILQVRAAISPGPGDGAIGSNGQEHAKGDNKTDLARWDGEGGAGPDGAQESSSRTEVSVDVLQPANLELAHLRIRVIALENLVITLLAEASDRQIHLARELAKFIAPQPGVVPHPLAIHASAHMMGLIDRARHFRVNTPR
jgi:uncharacterized protein YeaO (DUF488 family)